MSMRVLDWTSAPGSACNVSDEIIAQTHPGFKIICEKCNSHRVVTDCSLGWSAESGGWGSLDLVCLDCDARIEIMGA